MDESEKQFSFTRVASSTSGHAKKQIPISLTGNMGDSLRLDYINQFGPTDAWVTLATVTLTCTSQLYFDVSAPGQPQRLYRIVPLP
jgi:hypothetical protein